MEKTLGEQRVRTDFNASNSDAVAELNNDHARLIDKVKAISDATTDNEVKRLCSLAMTDLESAAMWAVKAATAKPIN
jgi:hypothetical protein